METVSILLQFQGGMDCGDRIWGVFNTPQEAEAALKRLHELEKGRLGSALPKDFLADFHISTFQVGVLVSYD